MSAAAACIPWKLVEIFCSLTILEQADSIKTIELGKKERAPFLDPLVLSGHIAKGVREARKRSSFATPLAQAAIEAQDKAIRDGREL